MKKIKIGVLGCANIAKRSMIPAILELKEKFELVAIASRTEEKAKEYADLFNCEPIVGYNNLIKREDIKSVYIPLPTGLHKKWIIKALKENKHVYAEKSMAMTFQDAEEMIKLAKSKNLALMEGYMFQYHTQHQKVIEIIKNGTIGEIRHFKASFGFPPFSDSSNFRYNNLLGGGALKDAAGYVVRSASFLLNIPLKVQGASVYYDPITKTSLYGSAYLTGYNGIGASLSFGFDNFYQCNYEIWGSKGKLTANKAFTPKQNERTTLLLETSDGSKEIVCEPNNHFIGAMNEFYSICNYGDKNKHYNEIIFQSYALDAIEKISKEDRK